VAGGFSKISRLVLQQIRVLDGRPIGFSPLKGEDRDRRVIYN
jgi:hypothetical protein